MKNEKFCFNKGTGLVAIVGILLIGFVLANQTLTNTQTSTNSRASAPGSMLRGGGQPTSAPTAPSGTLILSELLKKADAFMKTLDTALARPATLNTAKLQEQKNEVVAATKDAEAKYQVVIAQVATSKESIAKSITSITESRDDGYRVKEAADQEKINADGDLEQKKADLAATTQALADAAQVLSKARNTTTPPTDRLQDAQDKVASKLSEMSTARTQFVSALKGLPAYSSIPNWEGNRPAEWVKKIEAVRPDDAQTLAGVLDTITNEKYSVWKVTIKPFQTVLATSKPVASAYKTLKEKIILTLAAQNQLANVESKISVAETAYQTAIANNRAALAAYSTAQATAQKAAQDAQNASDRLNVYNFMLVEAQKAQQEILNLIVEQTKVLPIGLIPVSFPANTYDVDLYNLELVKHEVDAVNGALSSANAAYETLSGSIEGGVTEVKTEVKNYGDYCKGIKSSVALYPVVEYNTSGDALVETLPALVAQVYSEQHCATNTSKPKWNGIWGAGAKCYTATGLCSTQEGCNNKNCILNIGGKDGTACIYAEVPLSNCATGPFADLVANQSLTCSPKAYFRVGSDYYAEGALMTRNGRNYCGNKKLSLESEINAAKQWIENVGRTALEKKKIECAKNSFNYGFGNNDLGVDKGGKKKQLVIQLSSGMEITPSMVCFRLGTRVNQKTLTCENEYIQSDKPCNCIQSGYKITAVVDGKAQCSDPRFNE